MTDTQVRTGRAPVGELDMYYEIHGSGRPLVLLHGAYMIVESFGPFLEGLAQERQVIVPEMQGHGRTADIDREITYEQMADDTAGLIEPLQLGIRHPGLARRMVAASASYTSAGIQPEAWAMFPSISPEMFAGSPMEPPTSRSPPTRT